MKRSYEIWPRTYGAILLVCFAVSLVACHNAVQPVGTVATPKPVQLTLADLRNERAGNAFNKHAIDSAISMLHSGDLVLRIGGGADSYMLSQMNQRDKTFSHCGIVFIENGYPFVYHSIGGEDNPDERLRRDSAVFFFSPLHNLGLGVVRYNIGEQNINDLQKIVLQYYRERRKFDMDFDLKTDDKLYCAEFVYKAMNTALKDTSFIKPTTMLGHRFVGVDDLFMNKHARMIWQIKYK
jgi:hypothetical protein